MTADRLCPKCGAYWQCSCVLEEWRQPMDKDCPHDWVPAVGVDRDEDLPEEAEVIVCRLCGTYSLGVIEG